MSILIKIYIELRYKHDFTDVFASLETWISQQIGNNIKFFVCRFCSFRRPLSMASDSMKYNTSCTLYRRIVYVIWYSLYNNNRRRKFSISTNTLLEGTLKAHPELRKTTDYNPQVCVGSLFIIL